MSLDELSAIYESVFDRDDRQFRQNAALQGVKIPTKEEEEAKKVLDRVNEKIKARIPEEKQLSHLGIGVVKVN